MLLLSLKDGLGVWVDEDSIIAIEEFFVAEQANTGIRVHGWRIRLVHGISYEITPEECKRLTDILELIWAPPSNDDDRDDPEVAGGEDDPLINPDWWKKKGVASPDEEEADEDE